MKPTEQAHLNIEAGSHPGLTGKQNEDRFGVTAFLGGPQEDVPAVLAVLCDGIGGHRAGEVAAAMGVRAITDQVMAADLSQPVAALEKAIRAASAAIYAASQADQGRAGMGATCACAWVIGDRLYTANLGDSRIYLLRAGHFNQLSTDHTWVQEALDAGLISDRQGADHPNAHIIRRYLGAKDAPRPDFRLWYFEGEDEQAALANQGMRLLPGDILLLCSDGLTDLVTDLEIQAVLEGGPLRAAPEKLIGMANARGGHDNITVILLEAPPVRGPKADPARGRWLRGCGIAAMVGLLLLTGAWFGWRGWEGRPAAPDTPTPTVTLTVLPGEALPSATPSLTKMTPAEEGQPAQTVTARPSITPWPTDTPSP